MGLLDKVKNLFTEEVEVEVEEPKKVKKRENKEEKEDIQKEVIQVEIPSPVQTKEEPIVEEKKEEYKFPFFDDNDFDTIDIKRREEKKIEKKSIYNPPKEEKKIFKPSPIISPVYGFLDKNYQKEEIIQKKNDYNPRRATVDEIRDRAYGSLESDIESTLLGTNRVLFDEDNKKDALEEELNLKTKDEEYDANMLEEKPRHEKLKSDDDLTELLEAEMAKTSKQEKKKTKPRKISDKELFNLIDSMYEKEIK